MNLDSWNSLKLVMKFRNCLILYKSIFSNPVLRVLNMLIASPAEGLRLHCFSKRGYNTKLYLMVRLQFWNFGKCGVLLHCCYSPVHSDLESQYLIGSHLSVLKLLVLDRNTWFYFYQITIQTNDYYNSQISVIQKYYSNQT